MDSDPTRGYDGRCGSVGIMLGAGRPGCMFPGPIMPFGPIMPPGPIIGHPSRGPFGPI